MDLKKWVHNLVILVSQKTPTTSYMLMLWLVSMGGTCKYSNIQVSN